MTLRAFAILAPLLALAACAEGYVEPTPSEQMDLDLQRTGEAAVEGIDTTGFDALEP